MTDLLAFAESKKIRVQEAPLHRVRGFYQPETRLIVISSHLTQIQAHCTLAHELGHAVYGDRPTRNHSQHDFQERRANEWAATTIIDPHDYAEAEQLYGPHPGALAQQLRVTRELIEAWQNCYRRAA